MKSVINIYCDESCHLENDGHSFMGLGAFLCPKEQLTSLKRDLTALKEKHNLSPKYEIKWNKISSGKLDFYLDLVDYYFEQSHLGFRALIVPEKDKLDFERFELNHNEFYYRMYFLLLNKVFRPSEKFNIFLDKKDTVGSHRTEKLHQVLCNSNYDSSREMINRIQIDSSNFLIGIQLADFFLGAVMYANRELESSTAKLKVVERIRVRSGKNLLKKTRQDEYKMNIFPWVKR